MTNPFDPKSHDKAIWQQESAISPQDDKLGGRNLDELYITTSTQGFTSDHHREQPNAGFLFRCKVDVPGVVSHAFAG